ncbi:MAG: hypothetical protein RLZZ175_186 [Bacteroidota bacterium]|jgi:hypothetical protein
MNKYIEEIKVEIEPLRQSIVNHPVYAEIKTIEDLNIFMEYHIFAVWDFMSLLKSLQNSLTCTSVPWFPVGSADTRYLINEIVVGEESDVDQNGKRTSHFELYLDAMNQSGANTSQINTFIDLLKNKQSVNEALVATQTPSSVQSFVNNTFDIINSKKDYLQAAIFTFGREDLIPNMFIAIVNDLCARFPNNISIFKYYLERHIEVDGDHHSHLALQMIANLCGDDANKWLEAKNSSIISLKNRIILWDGALETIRLKNKN